MNWRSCIATLLAAFVVYPNCCCLLGADSVSEMGHCEVAKAAPKCCQTAEKPSPTEKSEDSCPHQQGKLILKQSSLIGNILKPGTQKPILFPYLPVLEKACRLDEAPSLVTLENQIFLRSPPLPSLRQLHCRYLI